MSMLAERAKHWEAEWLQQGIQRGLAAERELLRHQAERKFNLATAEELARRLDTVTDTERLTEIGGWIIDCDTSAELLDNLDAI